MKIKEDDRMLRTAREDAPEPESIAGHCFDSEKCNADTFCDCPCRTCMATKRGEYTAR